MRSGRILAEVAHTLVESLEHKARHSDPENG